MIVPPPEGREGKSYSAYILAELLHEKDSEEWKSKPVKVEDVPGVGGDVIWDEEFSWTFDADDLTFLRCVPVPSPPTIPTLIKFVWF